MRRRIFSHISEHKYETAFVAGAITALAGYKIVTSDAFKEQATKTMSKALMIKKEAEENLQDIREGAEDLCVEAKEKNKKEVFIEDKKE